MTRQPEQPLVGCVELIGLRCPGRHGAYPGERDAPRVFLVDVQAQADIAQPASTDVVDDAPDIAALAAVVGEVVAGPPRALLERVAWDIARTLLQQFPVVELVRVRLRKPAPPELDADEEAIALSLRRL